MYKFIPDYFREKKKVFTPWKTKKGNAYPTTREKGKRRSISKED